MEHRDGIGHVIHRHNVDAIRRAKWQRRQTREEYKSANHVELVRFWPPAVAQHDARPENRARHIRQKLPHHVLAEFLGARVGIVVRAIPIDRSVLLHYFIRTLAAHRDGAHVAEAAQSMIVARPHRELDHFERSAQIHVEAALLGFAIERSGAMNHGIGAANEAAVIVVTEPELRVREIAQKNRDLRIQEFFEARKIHVQLQRPPDSLLRFLQIASANQQVQRLRIIREKV